MKKMFLIIAWLTMVGFQDFSTAHDQSSKPKKAERVYCCHMTGPEKGQCDKLHTKEDCEKEGGKVVKDCKECR